MMKRFNQLFISTAVFSALSAYAGAETTPVDATASAQELETVTVKSDRQGVKVKTNVVTTRIKDESTETDLRGLLKNEPSISMGGGNGTSQFIYLRGMGQNSVDVKLDNAYTDTQIHYHQGRHMLDPALVKIVSVQKGAGSASAGIGQTNGAIIAKTLDAADLLKNSSNPNFGARINAGVSSNHSHNYGLAVFGKNDTLDFLIAGNRVKETDYEAGKGFQNGIDGSNRVPFSALDKTSYLIKFGLTPHENHRFVLSHLNEQHQGTRTVREEFSAQSDLLPGLNLLRQAPAERKMTVTKTDLSWQGRDMGFAQSAEANIYYLIHGRESADDSRNGYAGGSRNGSGTTKTRVFTTGANVNFDSRILDNVLLKYGVNYRHEKIKPNALFSSNLNYQEKQDVGFYVEGITDIADKVTLTTGLRYDHFHFKGMDGRKRNDGALNPSIGVIYEPIPQLSFSASHNYATRSPRLQDALMSQGNRLYTIGDNTKAEQARNTEIGFNFNNGTFGLEGNYFWQNIKDALGTNNGRDNHSNAAQIIINAGRIKNKGYELAGSFHWKGLTARLGVAHAKPRFYGERLSTNPDYAAVIGRTWTASLLYRFDKPNLEIGLHHRQVEKVKAKDNYIKAGSVAGTDKPGYGVTDFTANWKPFGNDKMNVNFAVNNIGNRYYQPHAQRGTGVVTLPGAGREYRLGVNYTF